MPCPPPLTCRAPTLPALCTAVGMNHTSGVLFDLSLVRGGVEVDTAKNALLYGAGKVQEWAGRGRCQVPGALFALGAVSADSEVLIPH